MSNDSNNEFKGANVDEAIKTGLAELGLAEEDAEIEVLSTGGIFTRAKVRITAKPKEEVEETPEEAPASFAEETTSEYEALDAEEPAHAEKNIETDEAVLAVAEKEALAFVTELVDKMGVIGTVKSSMEDGEINISVNGDNASCLIGYRGETLDAIQYYTLLVCNKTDNPFIRIQVDAENYRSRRKDTLSALAMRLARKSAKTQRPVSLEPMNPFERRVIHTALAGDKFVTTKSEGEGKSRHVVIVPNERPQRSGRDGKGGKRFDGNKPRRLRSERRYDDYDDDVTPAPKAPEVEEPMEMSYGMSSDFRKKGPTKMRSFGGKAKRF